MEIKVGDKVKLRSDLVDSNDYGSVSYFESFKKDDFKNEYMEVVKVDSADKTFKVKDGRWWFSFEMVHTLKTKGSETTPEFKVGDKVRLKAGLENNKYYGSVEMYDFLRFDGLGTVKRYEGDNPDVRKVQFTRPNGQTDFWFYSTKMLELVDSVPDDKPKPKPEKPKCKYKVGDKVRVRADLNTRCEYHMEHSSKALMAVPGMIDFAGKVVTIKEVDGRYRIEEYSCWWVDGMFEGLAESEPVTERVFMDDLETVEPIVIYPNCEDTFTSSWMKDFMKRYGG